VGSIEIPNARAPIRLRLSTSPPASRLFKGSIPSEVLLPQAKSLRLTKGTVAIQYRDPMRLPERWLACGWQEVARSFWPSPLVPLSWQCQSLATLLRFDQTSCGVPWCTSTPVYALSQPLSSRWRACALCSRRGCLHSDRSFTFELEDYTWAWEANLLGAATAAAVLSQHPLPLAAATAGLAFQGPRYVSELNESDLEDKIDTTAQDYRRMPALKFSQLFRKPRFATSLQRVTAVLNHVEGLRT